MPEITPCDGETKGLKAAGGNDPGHLGMNTIKGDIDVKQFHYI